jgi:hypothetical protein
MFSMYSGYGNLAPKTGPGKVVTIIYALIGKTKHFHCAIVRSDIVCCVYQSAHQHQPTPFSAAFPNIVPCEPAHKFRDLNQTATILISI